MRAYLLKPAPGGGARHGLVYRGQKNGFDRLAAGYGAPSVRALKHQPVMPVLMVTTIFLTGYLFAAIPKGFFPQQVPA
jgi:multidrug efflux pump subunit AcrB